MGQIPRRRIALFLTVFYCCILLTPLAPCAMQSKQVAHAVTGECVGECDICGCSPEARANHTCCCWRKKRLQQQEQPATQPVAAGCCSMKMKQCAADEGQCDMEEPPADECGKKKTAQRQVVFKCGCPCGNGKSLTLMGGIKFEQLPVELLAIPSASSAEAVSPASRLRLTARHVEPPEPPPRLSIPS